MKKSLKKSKAKEEKQAAADDEDWWIEDTSLGFPLLSDADTGATENEEVNEPEISAYTQFLEEDLWPDDIMDSKGLLKTNEIFRKKSGKQNYKILSSIRNSY